jgi:chromosomal replication initiation ATPase DnaA
MAVPTDQLSSSFSGLASRLSINSKSDELIDTLEISLRRLIACADDLSLPLVQAVCPALSALTRSRSTDRLALISDQICRDFRLGPDKLRSKSREQRITFARQLAIFLCRRITGRLSRRLEPTSAAITRA